MLGERLTPHMLTGLPSASRGVRFLLNFLPPCQFVSRRIESIVRELDTDLLSSAC